MLQTLIVLSKYTSDSREIGRRALLGNRWDKRLLNCLNKYRRNSNTIHLKVGTEVDYRAVLVKLAILNRITVCENIISHKVSLTI
jgi:hypothetical protein